MGIWRYLSVSKCQLYTTGPRSNKGDMLRLCYIQRSPLRQEGSNGFNHNRIFMLGFRGRATIYTQDVKPKIGSINEAHSLVCQI
jgi:hypothetical protein